MFSRFIKLFSDPEKLEKNVDAAVADAGTKAEKFMPKDVKVNNTVLVQMGNIVPEVTNKKGGVKGKEKLNSFTIAFTKVADMPDGSGLFQITGTTSTTMLKGLVGTENMQDLIDNSVMALVAPNGFQKDQPATMKILKSILPGGKDYVSKSKVTGAILKTDLDKIQKL